MNVLKVDFILIITICLFADQLIETKKSKRGYVLNHSKPNIIFIMADDLDVTLGSPEVMLKTKRILRQEGVTFTNAFTTTPLCCPSRSSILTGRYAHNHDVNTNNRNCSGPSWINGPEKETVGVLMKKAGYTTAYFGKYLNNYDGNRVPPGWDNWHGLIRNSRYYNYAVNVNGKIVRHHSDYKKDYFTDLMGRQSIHYFRKHVKTSSKPLFMVVSMSAPHGPEDAAPQYQDRFPEAFAPRFPSYNYTSRDKHWIIRNTPPLDNLTSHFTDVLYRKRLQTLLSIDDVIGKVYLMLRKTRQLQNTYIIFTSDHGYHLGQFNQVKGKSQPYESDVRIPLYIRGPKIPWGVEVPAIALNIDIAPTLLDIAGEKPGRNLDGSSIMDVAVGHVINWRKRKIYTPIWRDTFLIERGKMQTIDRKKKSEQVQRLVFHTSKNNNRVCSQKKYPEPPCTKNKDFICYSRQDKWYLERCNKDKRQPPACSCLKANVDIIRKENETTFLLLQLEKQFEKLKRRIQRHGIKALQKYSLYSSHLGNSSISISAPRNDDLMSRKVDEGLQKMKQFQKERQKITRNRQLSKHLTLSVAQKMQKSSKLKHDTNSTTLCSCKVNKKNSGRSQGRDMKCFYFHKGHWKTPPLWTGPSFTACTNSPNSSYWCLRTINATHNFLYCEFVTGFKEYFNITNDPYQLTNLASLLKPEQINQLHAKVQYMRSCRGAKSCFLKNGENLSERKDTLRKIRRYERRKRHGILVRGNMEQIKSGSG